MMHNLLITRPHGLTLVTDEAMNLGLRGQEMSYVPVIDEVLFHTVLLQPETEETIYFIAPSESGEYPFVCTFPGHSMTMNGVMVVTG
jgi:azurin